LDFVNELFESNLLNSGGAIPDGHHEEATGKQTVVPFRNGIMLSIAAGWKLVREWEHELRKKNAARLAARLRRLLPARSV
jgi:7-cyano-7-deazaguanine synthase in queuosine biosynthesis